MQKLTNNDYKLFCSICTLSQNGLKKTLNAYLKKKYAEVICAKDYIYAKGDIEVGLTAHLDTVFKTPPSEEDIFFDREKNVIWSRAGGIGDDRAGVFAILKIIQSGLKPTVIFTTDEEKGCLGAEALTKAYPNEPPSPLKYIIELDRRGSGECVFYDCDNKEFSKYIESYGFVTALGSFSDITELCPAWGCAGCNLSVGYEDEHSYTEILRVTALLQTIEKVKNMLKQENIPEFCFVPGPYLRYFSNLNWYGEEDSDLEDSYILCDGCKKSFPNYSMIPVGKKNYCPDCVVDRVGWCKNCGEPYEITADSPPDEYCEKCQNKNAGGKNECTKKFRNSLIV